MKKVFITLMTAAVGCGMLTSCGMGTMGTTAQPTTQNTGASSSSDLLGAMANGVLANAGDGSILGNIISTFASGVTTNKSTLVGTWNYARPCVQFESENLLSKAGGSVAAANMETKLETIYQKVGIKPGACKFVFNKDNTCQYAFGGKTYTGTYSFDSTKKIVTITSQMGFQMSAYVSVSGNNMGLTFDSTKLLTLLTGSQIAQSALGGLTALAGSFSGMKMGFQFTR